MGGTWQDLYTRFLQIIDRPMEGISAPWCQVWHMFLCHPWYQQQLNHDARFITFEGGGPQDLVDDLRQDAMLLLARDLERRLDLGFDRARPANGFPRWMRTIVSRHCREALRRRRQNREHPTDAILDLRVPDHAQLIDRQMDVYTVIATLSPRERTVVLLRMEGWTFDNIARELREPPQTIYSVWQRALEHLHLGLIDE